MLVGPAAADPQIGAAQIVVNAVTGAIPPTQPEVVLRAGIDVFPNEIVATGENSASLLIFQDKTQLSVGAHSKIVLDRFVFDPDPSKSAVTLSIVAGIARFATGLLPKEDYKIITPGASLTVRGTTFIITVDNGGTTQVDVITGTVACTGAAKTILVDAGHSCLVSPGLPPSGPFLSPPSSTALNLMDMLLMQSALQTYPIPGINGPPPVTTNQTVSPSR